MKQNDKKTTKTTETPTPATPVVAPTAIDLSQLTPDQITKLAKQLKEARKADKVDHDSWVKIVDTALHEREGDGFRWTTGDILSQLQAKGLAKPTLDTEQRQSEIKKIQTRKQLLEKKRDDKGNLVHTVGYKASSNSFGPMDASKIVAWLSVPANVELVSVGQADAITKALAHILNA